MSNTTGFGGDVGLSLLELLKGDTTDAGMKSVRQDSTLSGSVKDAMSNRSGDTWGSGKFFNSSDSDLMPVVDVPLRVEPETLTEEQKRDQSQTLLKSIDTSLPLQEILETADEWLFDAFELNRLSGGHPLSVLSLHIMMRLNLLDTFSI